MNPLLNIPTELIQSGLHPALPPNQAPFWLDGRNVIFRDGGVRPEPSQGLFFPKTEASPIRGMLELHQEFGDVLYYSTINRIWKYDPQTKTSTLLYTYPEQNVGVFETESEPAKRVAMVSWGDWVVASSAHHDIVVDKNEGAGFVPLTGTPVPNFRPQILVKLGPYMTAVNHDDGQAGHVTFFWCHTNDLERWTPAADSDAGSFPVHDAPSPFRTALRYGAGIVAITDNTLHGISYIQSPYIFGTGARVRGIGAVSKHSVVEAIGLLFGFGPRGLWQSDGVTYEYIDHPSVQDYIFTDLNRKQLSQVHAWHDIQNERIVWWWCSRDSQRLNRALGYHYNTKCWHIPDFIREASTNTEVFDYPLIADAFGNVYIVGVPGGLAPLPYKPVTIEEKLILAGETGYGRGGYGRGFYGGLVKLGGD